MTRRRRVCVTLVVAVVLVVAPLSAGAAATQSAAAAGQAQGDGTTQTQNETDEPEEDGDEGRNLTGENQTAIAETNETAVQEANLTNGTQGPAPERGENRTFPARQEYNGTFRVGNATGVYDHAVVTGRNGSINIFVRNMTVATENGTTTMLNTLVAIGDNRSARELRQLNDALAEAFENGTAAPDETAISPVGLNETEAPNETEPDERVAGEDAEVGANETGANVTETNQTNQTDPQLRDLGLAGPADELARTLPESALDAQFRMKVDVVNVRQNGTVTTYRNVLLRGTFREVLTGEAETAERTVNRTAGANVTVGREYFTVRDLEAPETVAPGETYTVNATVANSGDDDGAEEVAYVIAGEPQRQRVVRLGPGESTNVSFEVNLGRTGPGPGTYQHGVYAFADSATAVLTVGEGESQDGDQTQTQPQNETQPQDGEQTQRPDGGQDDETEQEGDAGTGQRPEPQPQE